MFIGTPQYMDRCSLGAMETIQSATSTYFGKLSFKELRERTGMSQKEIAQRVGYSRTTISLIERGLRQPTEEFIEELAKAMLINPVCIRRAFEMD
jgi:DNA-binding XRE family transcriptional regulator